MTGTGTFTTDTTGGGLAFGGVISGANDGLIINGGGTVTLTGANSYTGGTTVNAGTLLLNFAGSGAPATNIISASSSLFLNGAALSLVGNASTTNSQKFAATTIGAGASAITLSANATANPLLLNLGAIIRNTGGTVVFTLSSGTQSSINGVVTSAGVTDGILGPWAAVSGTGTAANDSANGFTYATLSGSNIVPYTGATSESSNTSAWGGIPSGGTGTVNYDISATYTAGSDLTGLVRDVNTIRYTGAGLSQESNGNSNDLSASQWHHECRHRRVRDWRRKLYSWCGDWSEQ